MTISLLVAMSENRVIGRDNKLPWHLSADLQRFKRLTMGHHLVMGRKTFESIGRPLPGRTMIVVTRQPGYCPQGVLIAHSLKEALEKSATDDEVIIAGGADLFRQTLPTADRIYLTLVHARIEGDVFFPEIDLESWRVTHQEAVPADEKNDYPTTFLIYERPPSISAQQRGPDSSL